MQCTVMQCSVMYVCNEVFIYTLLKIKHDNLRSPFFDSIFPYDLHRREESAGTGVLTTCKMPRYLNPKHCLDVHSSFASG